MAVYIQNSISNLVTNIVKVPIYRLALGGDPFSQFVIRVHNFFSWTFSCGRTVFRDFDPSKAEASLERFQQLGAGVEFVQPDGGGQVQMMTFRWKELEARILQLGGRWERTVLENREVFAIAPPMNNSEEWDAFAEKLSHFHWETLEDGRMITCDCAKVIPEQGEDRCVLFAHSTSSAFTSDWKRAGYLLGARLDICFFDNGNTWENQDRPPSVHGFYQEVDAVFEKIKGQYAMQNLWVGGACGGAPVAAYLKYRYHVEGINFFAEKSFPKIDDFVEQISPWLVPYVQEALIDPSPNFPDTQFSVEKMWQTLNPSNVGQVVVIDIEGDEHISLDAQNRYFELAQRINTQAHRITFISNERWRHADDFYRYQEARERFLQIVFSYTQMT